MLTLWDARYNKSRYKFLFDSIDPPCPFFIMSSPVSECENCQYRTVCSDLRSLLLQIDFKMSICGDKNTRSYHRKNKKE